MTVTNPELVSAMENIARQDLPENRQALYAAFLKSELLVPIANPLPGGAPTGLQLVVGTTDVEFIVAQSKQGHTALLAFTDEDAAKLWKPECVYISTQAQDLFSMALEMNVASIIMNVAGPTARGELNRWEFQALVNGKIPASLDQVGTQIITPPPDADVHFGKLTQKPSAKLLKGIQEGLASQPEIVAGYLMETQIDQAAPHLVAGIQFGRLLSEEEIRNVMNELGDKISAVLPEGEFIDFIVIDNELNVPVTPISDVLVFKR